MGTNKVLIYDGLCRKNAASADFVHEFNAGGALCGIGVTADNRWIMGVTKFGIFSIGRSVDASSMVEPIRDAHNLCFRSKVVRTPEAVVVLPDDMYAFCDSELHAVGMLIASTNTHWTLAGGDGPGFVDGIGSAARFNGPKGIAVLPNGDLVVADTGNNALRRVIKAGVVTTMSLRGRHDGLKAPEDVAVDETGLIIVADTGNSKVREVRNGVMTTLGNAWMDELAPVAVAIDQRGHILMLPRAKPGIIVKFETSSVQPGFTSYAPSVRVHSSDIFSRLMMALVLDDCNEIKKDNAIGKRV